VDEVHHLAQEIDMISNTVEVPLAHIPCHLEVRQVRINDFYQQIWEVVIDPPEE